MKNKLINNQKGAALIATALSLIAVLGFAALGVDVGSMLTARNQLQSAADAAALGGVSGLMQSQTEAQTRAIQVGSSNTMFNNPVAINVGDISFPSATEVRVQLTQPINLFFARAVGLNAVNISASATADLTNLGGTRGFRPFAVPELAWNPGQIVVIKSGSKDEPYTNPSFYYPVCFPPANRGTPDTGAKRYEDRIVDGYEDMAYIGDELVIEPGMMTGPTKKGITDLLAMDPNASWNGSEIVNSDFPATSSPRVLKLPMFDTSVPPPPGRHSITMSNMANFFLLPMQGNNVLGVFMGLVSSGVSGTTTTHIKMVHLTN